VFTGLAGAGAGAVGTAGGGGFFLTRLALGTARGGAAHATAGRRHAAFVALRGRALVAGREAVAAKGGGAAFITATFITWATVVIAGGAALRGATRAEGRARIAIGARGAAPAGLITGSLITRGGIARAGITRAIIARRISARCLIAGRIVARLIVPATWRADATGAETAGGRSRRRRRRAAGAARGAGHNRILRIRPPVASTIVTILLRSGNAAR
jgi:hypothetical protein